MGLEARQMTRAELKVICPLPQVDHSIVWQPCRS